LAARAQIRATGEVGEPPEREQHLPGWVPERHLVVYATGVVEIVLGAGLTGPGRWRPALAVRIAAPRAGSRSRYGLTAGRCAHQRRGRLKPESPAALQVGPGAQRGTNGPDARQCAFTITEHPT
jgi:hypothetical protein